MVDGNIPRNIKEQYINILYLFIFHFFFQDLIQAGSGILLGFWTLRTLVHANQHCVPWCDDNYYDFPGTTFDINQLQVSCFYDLCGNHDPKVDGYMAISYHIDWNASSTEPPPMKSPKRKVEFKYLTGLQKPSHLSDSETHFSSHFLSQSPAVPQLLKFELCFFCQKKNGRTKTPRTIEQSPRRNRAKPRARQKINDNNKNNCTIAANHIVAKHPHNDNTYLKCENHLY